MSSLFSFINGETRRRFVVPVAVALTLGCVMGAFLWFGGGGSSARELGADEGTKKDVKRVAKVEPNATPTPKKEPAPDRNQSILDLLQAGTTMTFDSTGEGSAVSFPRSMTFRNELLDSLSAVSGLTTLTVDHSAMNDAGIPAVVQQASLQRLSLIRTAITDTGLSNLCQHTGLTHLTIEGGSVTGASLAELASLRNLQTLRRSGLQGSAETMQRLVQSTSIRTLDLTGATITDEAARVLLSSSLKTIDLTGTGVADSTLSALRVALPDSEILPLAEAPVPKPVADVSPETPAVSPEEVQSAEGALTETTEEKTTTPLKLMAVPDEETIRNARLRLQKTLKSEYASARTRSKQRELAAKLLELARDFADNDPVRFVILDEAIQYGLKAADWEFAVDVIEELSTTFDINTHSYRADAMAQAARLCERGDAADVSRLSLSYADSAVDQERFEEAVSLTHAALSAARRAGSTSLTRQIVDRSKAIAAERAACEEAKAARVILEHTPNDEKASLTLGRYLALHRGDWSEALPHLAVSGQEGWAEIARLEQKGLTKPDDQVKLAERWLTLIEGLKTEAERQALQAHAASWLTRAVPALSKLEQLRVEKLLASIQPETEERPEPKQKIKLAGGDRNDAGYGRVITTDLIGGPGGAPFRWMTPNDAILIGFRVSISKPISMIQPIYQTEKGVERGPIFGEETTRHVDIVANRGYQVGGLVLKTGDFIKGLSVTFVEIHPRNRLRPRWYDSKYVGDEGPGRVTRLGNADILVVGFHGRGHTLVDALGLLGRSRTKIADAKPEDAPPKTRTE